MERLTLKIVAKDEKYKPKYANETDFCQDLKVRIENEEGKCQIRPNECVTIGTGIQVAVPNGYGLIVSPRSSTGSKLKCELANTIGIIDAGYRDEIKLAIHNFGTENVELLDGQRICQFFILPKITIENLYVEDDEDFRSGDRCGGFGSSGKF